MLRCFKTFGEVCAELKWKNICSQNDRAIVNKLFQSEVSRLASKLSMRVPKEALTSKAARRHRSNLMEVLRGCDKDISLIALMAKEVDLSAVDEQGDKPVDYILREYRIRYYQNDHLISGSALDIDDELQLKLLCSLMDRKVLNSSYRWGYSYFSVFVLLGWWNVVRWGLDNGADVSDNGVCCFTPIDAVFAHRVPSSPAVSLDIFARLLHPTTVNRPIIPGSDPCTLPADKMPRALHKVIGDTAYPRGSIRELVKTGARVDVRNSTNELPMDIYAVLHVFKQMTDVDEFRLLVPQSMGLTPSRFLNLLTVWAMPHPPQEVGQFIKTIVSEFLTLSSGWNDLTLMPTVPTRRYWRNSLNYYTVSIGGQAMTTMCICRMISVIDLLTKCGIRAKTMSEFQSPRNIPHRDARCQQRLDELRDKWNNYREFVPSLQLQCVRSIRTSLHIVSDERLQKLPIPKPLRLKVSLQEEIQHWFSVFACSRL